MTDARPPGFTLVDGDTVMALLRGHEAETIEVVRTAYQQHYAGSTVNPSSQFLRFADRPSDRIIALPAAVGDPVTLAGIKWIASVPANVGSGLPRASAVIVLNDMRTGHPFACLEGSHISAARTAASAALAARELTHDRRPKRLSVIGAGLIARHVEAYLASAGLQFEEVAVHDAVTANAETFAARVGALRGVPVRVCRTTSQALRSGDVVVMTTTAPEPHLDDPADVEHGPVVLHLSLRDLGPRIISAAVNVVDDVEHCLTARTSVHLVELSTGSRDHIHGTLDDVLAGRLDVADGRPVVFSPFGLGVLDLAVAQDIHDRATASGAGHTFTDFFSRTHEDAVAVAR